MLNKILAILTGNDTSKNIYIFKNKLIELFHNNKSDNNEDFKLKIKLDLEKYNGLKGDTK